MKRRTRYTIIAFRRRNKGGSTVYRLLPFWSAVKVIFKLLRTHKEIRVVKEVFEIRKNNKSYDGAEKA